MIVRVEMSWVGLFTRKLNEERVRVGFLLGSVRRFGANFLDFIVCVDVDFRGNVGRKVRIMRVTKG